MTASAPKTMSSTIRKQRMRGKKMQKEFYVSEKYKFEFVCEYRREKIKSKNKIRIYMRHSNTQLSQCRWLSVHRPISFDP